MNTSEKLNKLADLIEGPLAHVFNQRRNEDCVIGLGTRLREDGTLRDYSGLTDDFAFQYGIEYDHARALLLSEYSQLNIGVRSMNLHQVTPEIAADVLRKLAKKYGTRRA